LSNTWDILSKYSAKILDILKRDQTLNKNSDKILIKIKKDKNETNAKKAKTLLLLNLALIEYKTQRI
jgi:hypothetical protein